MLPAVTCTRRKPGDRGQFCSNTMRVIRGRSPSLRVDKAAGDQQATCRAAPSAPGTFHSGLARHTAHETGPVHILEAFV